VAGYKFHPVFLIKHGVEPHGILPKAALLKQCSQRGSISVHSLNDTIHYSSVRQRHSRKVAPSSRSRLYYAYAYCSPYGARISSRLLILNWAVPGRNPGCKLQPTHPTTLASSPLVTYSSQIQPSIYKYLIFHIAHLEHNQTHGASSGW